MLWRGGLRVQEALALGERDLDPGRGSLLVRRGKGGRRREVGNYLEDMARALVTLGERDEADGQVWHLPSAEPLTGRQFLELVFEAAGHPPKIGVASRPMIRMAGLFNPFLRELNETLYQFERPFVSDPSKFQRAFGAFEPMPHPEAVGRTADWFRRRYA